MTPRPVETPVALLVFNRPDTTARVLEAIRAARPRTLLVVADGPRADRLGERERCAEVRALLDRVDWPCDVRRNYSETNLGCGRRISSGLAWVFEQVERAILLEDDCLPHPDFFRFCETLLERYADDERVMMIGGTNYLRGELEVPSGYVFSRYFAIWGWATWRRAFAKYDFEMRHWPALREAGALASVYRQGFMQEHFTKLFDLVHGGAVDTWDVQWFHTCLFESGLSVTPRRNLVSNIGLVGTHTSDQRSPNHELPVFPLDPGELVAPPLVHPERRYDEVMFERVFARRRSTLRERLTRIARRLAPAR